jgi:rod shape-determining protein MreC
MGTAASKRPVWITLTVALLVHTLLISLQASHRIDTTVVRGWILDSLAPAEKLVDRTLSGVGGIWGRYFALIGLHDENTQLRAQVEELRMALAKQYEENVEAARLRELLDLRNSGIGRTVVARVIGRDPTQSQQTVTLDKGGSHGLRPDSAVITPMGIVGRVIYCGNFFSVVQLISDSQSGVGVLVSTTRRQGILKGNGGRELDLDYVDDDNDLKPGDDVITSGMDRIYPKGLPVGVIASVGPRRGLFRAVKIRPRATLGGLEVVLCLLDRPQGTESSALSDGPGK